MVIFILDNSLMLSNISIYVIGVTMTRLYAVNPAPSHIWKLIMTIEIQFVFLHLRQTNSLSCVITAFTS